MEVRPCLPRFSLMPGSPGSCSLPGSPCHRPTVLPVLGVIHSPSLSELKIAKVILSDGILKGFGGWRVTKCHKDHD